MAEVNEGDWVEGAPKWWWKYVFPIPETLWLAVLARVEPVPQPWLQKVTGEVLEGLAMLHAAARAGEATGERLRGEAVAKINQAVAGIRQAELGQR
jgi:hypothetical protein